MTVKEVSSVIDIYTEKKKAEAKAEKIKIYNLALLNAAFVGRALAGKNIPDLDKVFPELAQDVQEQPQAQDDKSWLIIKEKMIDFANAANKHRKK